MATYKIYLDHETITMSGHVMGNKNATRIIFREERRSKVIGKDSASCKIQKKFLDEQESCLATANTNNFRVKFVT